MLRDRTNALRRTRNHGSLKPTGGRDHRLLVESLEDRRLLSAMPLGLEFQVNSYTTASQGSPSVAADAEGDFAVVWQSFGQDGDSNGIYAQGYSGGVPFGPEFRVNTYTTSSQQSPVVVANGDGDFVVAWESFGQDGSGFGVYAQRYNSSGLPVGSEFAVNTYTTGHQSLPSVAIDADGDFVVTWQSSGQDGDVGGIYAQRYDAAGVPQGSEFQVNTYTTSEQIAPSLAMNADGDFVVAWQTYGQDGGDYGVYARRYNSAGVAQGGEFQVNTYTTSSQRDPSLAMDADGNFVATWQSFGQDGDSYGVHAQRYDAAGVPLGSEFQVNAYTTGAQFSPSAVVHPDGAFLVAWESEDQDGDNRGIYARQYSGAGLPVGNEFQVNTYTTSAQTRPALAADAQGDFVVAWESLGQDGDNDGVYAQLYTQEFQVNTYTTSFQWAPSLAMDADGDFVVTWESDGQDGDDRGIYAQRYSTTGVPQGGEFQVNTYTTSLQSTPSVAMDAVGNSVVVWASFEQDGDNWGIYAQRFDDAGVPQGSEFAVNTYTTGFQTGASVAMDADGDFVVAWHSEGQDGSFEGIYAQRYNAAGVAQGSEFLINTYTTGQQAIPSVAMDSDGNFSVAWMSFGQDGDQWGIYAQRFDADGVPQGGEFQVNTYTTSRQADPSVAMDADGDFTVAWDSFGQDGSNYGVYAQRYNATGAAQGSEFRVSPPGTTIQHDPEVSMDANGNFVVTWEGPDGGGQGTLAQRYNAAGVALGSALYVNAYTTGGQRFPAVAMDDDGDFVVAWSSNGQDGHNYGIYARQYFPAPTPSSVTGRHLFYDNSKFDGGPSIDASDSAAIPAKTAYLPGGGTVTTASMTSYSRGLNGIFVDISGAHGTLILADFEFTMSDQGSGALNTNTPSTWTTAPAPTAFTVLSDTPAAGTDRVEFIWADNAIENRYLEVATLGNDAAGGNNTNTGLAATDLFYFGNIIGDTFNDAAPTVWLTTAGDETAIQASPIISVATIDSLFDVDRNGLHLSSDRIVARSNTIFALNKLSLTNPPASPAAAAGDDDGVGSAVASALTIPDASSLPDRSLFVPAPPSGIDSRGRVTAGLLELLEEPTGLRGMAFSEATDDVEDGLDFDEDWLDQLVTRLLS